MKWILGIITLLLAVFVIGSFVRVTSSPEQVMRHRIEAATSAAIAAKDPGKCSPLPESITHVREPDDEKGGGDYQTHPASDCLRAYYRATNDPTACTFSTLEESNNSCLDYMAEIYGDSSYCDQRTNVPTWRVDLCHAGAGDISECAKYSNNPNVYGRCVIMAVNWTKDETQCSLLLQSAAESDQARRDYNGCLVTVGRSKPEEREKLCSLMQYPEGTLPEKKAYCLIENWPENK